MCPAGGGVQVTHGARTMCRTRRKVKVHALVSIVTGSLFTHWPLTCGWLPELATFAILPGTFTVTPSGLSPGPQLTPALFHFPTPSPIKGLRRVGEGRLRIPRTWFPVLTLAPPAGWPCWRSFLAPDFPRPHSRKSAGVTSELSKAPRAPELSFEVVLPIRDVGV